MYEDADQVIERILKLVTKCPPELQASCFEILLNGYVNRSSLGKTASGDGTGVKIDSTSNPPTPPPDTHPLPADVRTRLAATAKRIGATVDQLLALFDLTTDPFTYHPLHVPGRSRAEKTRHVALLAAAKTYLATGQWTADWKEFRAMCVDQNCYDRTNMFNYMKGNSAFKKASAEEGVSLSSQGAKAAEDLLTKIATGSKDDE